MTENIIEDLAELEHEQWMTWSKTLSTFEELSDVRMKRWRLLWKPYSKLTEEQKEQDRIWARRTFIVMAQIYGNPYDEGFKAGQESFNACKKHIEKAGTMTIRHRVIYCEECRKELIDDARKEENQRILNEVEKISLEIMQEADNANQVTIDSEGTMCPSRDEILERDSLQKIMERISSFLRGEKK